MAHTIKKRPSKSPSGAPKRDSRTPQTQRVLNLPLLIVTLIVLATGGPTLYFWHKHQVGGTAQSFLDRATALETEDRLDEAADHLDRYLQLRPDDGDARARLAETYDRSPQGKRNPLATIKLYYRAVGMLPERSDLRGRLAELLLEVSRFEKAEEQAVMLGGSARGKRIAALALNGQSRSGGRIAVKDALTAINEAIDLDPGNIKLALAAAEIYRERMPSLRAVERVQLADAAIDRMVSTDNSNPAAFLARYEYHVHYKTIGSESDLATAFKLDPENPDVLLANGQSHLQQGVTSLSEDQAGDANEHFLQAARCFEQVIEAEPTDGRGHLGLGNVLLAQGKSKLAVEAFRSGSKQSNNHSFDSLLRLAEVLTALKRLDEVEEVLESLDRASKLLEQRLRKPVIAAVRSRVNFLRARWWFARNEHFKAIPLLKELAGTEKAVRNSQRGVVRHVQAWMMLGAAYASQRYWDQSAAAYEQAIAVEPGNAIAHLAAAEMWGNTGRFESSIQHFKRAFRSDKSLKEKESWLHFIKTRIQRERASPSNIRTWQEIVDDLEDAPKELHCNWQFPLLQAELALSPKAADNAAAEVDLKPSLAILQRAEKDFPDSIPLLQRLVITYHHMGETVAADRALLKVQRLAPDDISTKILASELLALRKDYKGARQLLQETVARKPLSQRFMLQAKMVELRQRAGEIDQARSELEALHKLKPNHIEIVRRLASHALAAGDETGLEHWESELKRIEGPQGSLWRFFRARRLLMGKPTATTDSQLMAAADLQEQLELQRPLWPSAMLLKGMIASRQGKLRQAIESLERAIELGERGTQVFEQLIALLYQTNRIADAQKYLSRLEEQAQASERLLPLAISVSTKMNDVSHAAELALVAVKRRPEDAMAHMWLGHTLMLAKDQQKEAEAAFKKSTELAPEDVRTWSGLFSFYIGQERKEEATSTLTRLSQEISLSPSRKEFVLAQGYEMLGEADQAAEHYQKARLLGSDDIPIQLRVAAFLVNRDIAESEVILRRVLKIEPDSDSARRALAAILATRGGETNWSEMTRLLSKSTSAGDVARLDRRLQAHLLARRGHLSGGGESDRIQARKILEELVRDSTKTVDQDYLLLARLYDAEGNYQAARDQYDVLVSRDTPVAAYLAYYVDLVLRRSADDRSQIGSAISLLKRLERLDPRSITTALLKAQLLKRQGTISLEAVDQLAKPFIEQLSEIEKNNDLTADEKKVGQIRLLASIGRLYSGVDLHKSAESWNRKLVLLSANAYRPLADSLAAQGRFKEAMDLCRENAVQGNAATAIIIAASVMASANAPADQMGGVEALVELALKDHKQNAHVLFSIAVLYTMQHKHEEAVAWFRKVHEIRPQDVLTLNNLATLLSETPQGRDEALRFAKQAIALAGREAPLLDTMGMIYLYKGQTKKALELFEKASEPSAMIQVDPRYHFHRAVALLRLDEVGEARKALMAADTRELERQILTEVERKLLLKLRDDLASNK